MYYSSQTVHKQSSLSFRVVWFLITRTLAYSVNSLVRVSRRLVKDRVTRSEERACQRNDEALYRPLIQVYSIYLPEPEDPSRRKDARNPVTHPVDNEGPRYFVEDSLSAMYSFPTSGPPVQAQERHQSLRTLTQTTTDSRRLRGTEFSQSRVLYPWRSTMSKAFSLSFQSAFHLSFTLLVRYRTWCNI